MKHQRGWMDGNGSGRRHDKTCLRARRTGKEGVLASLAFLPMTYSDSTPAVVRSLRGHGVPGHVSELPTLQRGDVELVLAARPENVAVVRHVMGGLAESLALDPVAVADLRLAVSEACTNVVVHAYEDAAEEVLEVDARLEANLLHIIVRDHGGGKRVAGDSPGLGLGLPIARSVSQSLDLGQTAAGNEVHMTFVVPGAPR